MVSTEGVGALARVIWVFNSLTIWGSERLGNWANFNKWAIRTGEKPASSMVAKSQPLPLT